MTATDRIFELPITVQKQLIALAAACPTEEVCGLILRSSTSFTVLEINNAAADRRYRYELEPKQLIAAFKQMRQTGEQLHAIYHSHPFSPPKPSETDCHEASYPDTPYVIVNPQATPPLRAFMLRNDGFDELILRADTAATAHTKH